MNAPGIPHDQPPLKTECANRPLSPFGPLRSLPTDNAAAERTAGAHILRPGMAMRWRSGGLRADEIADHTTGAEAACFVFVLQDACSSVPAVSADNPFGTVGWMTLVPQSALGDLRARTRAASFHLIVELSPEVLGELFQNEPEQNRANILALARPELPHEPFLQPITPAARLAVESVRRCPLAGACRTLVLSARCHDMLVEFISASGAREARPTTLMSDTETRVRAAAAALARHLDETPSLETLAREVGLSETTLKRGFHQIFGTTVFGHLRTLRMEHARTLLQSGQATVIEAAMLVGYSNPSNFASAFRRQFGLNPKEFQLAARR
jgi:AraC-like DNA-binding protein